MSKKSQRKKKGKKRQPSRQFPWLWLALGGVAVLVVGLLALQPWSGDGDESPPVTPQVFGSPRLQVDRTTVDEGYVKYDVPVRSTFRLRNVGDQPLKILETPRVELAQGC